MNIIEELPLEESTIWLKKLNQALNDEFWLGWTAQKASDFKTALVHYKHCAKGGHQGAQFHLYCVYSCGQGVSMNDRKYKHPVFTFDSDQRSLLLSCYIQCHDEASIQNNIGALYEYDNNYMEAFKWYKLSADQNYGPALYNLAKYYRNGHGIEVNKDQAMVLFRLSGEGGIDLGWASLGDMYFERDDYEKAFEFYNKVPNNSYAQCKLGSMYDRGYHGIPNYKMARHWFKLSALQGYYVAQYMLAERYLQRDKMVKAVIWYSLSANQGFIEARYKLGSLYFGKYKNYDKALYHFRLAAKAGHVLGQLYVGMCYERGCGVPIDHQESMKWYLLSAHQGNAVAQNNVGYSYLTGKGGPIDYSKARTWFLLSATQGFVMAQYHLGFLYDTGKGVDVNYAEAYDWYKLASDQDDIDAKERLLWFLDLKTRIQSNTKSYLQIPEPAPWNCGAWISWLSQE